MTTGVSASDPGFGRLFESVPGQHLVLDGRWYIVAASDAYLEITSTSRDEVVGRYLFDAFPDRPADPEREGDAHRLESLGDRIGGIAHDFNNLIGVVMNYAALVKEAIMEAAQEPNGERWEIVESDVQQIERAAERAVHLTRQLRLS